MNKNYIFTSESVSEGHPDKVCDIISDTILDLYLSKFNESRVACETLATTNKIVISGETRGPKISSEEIEQVVREQIKNIGYEQKGFHWQNLEFYNFLHEQSADIAQGVDASGNEKDEGAGDQGIMFGYACNETKELMPAPIMYSHKILKDLARARKTGELSLLGPDSKSQISVVYENSKPIGVSSVVVSSQHDESVDQNQVKEMIRPYVKKILPENWICSEDNFYVNPTGKFVIGGPDGDTGLTGRKIIVDTYGGAALQGGGAFSGKDPTKVDRSAAYIARYLAKNIVASGIVDKAVIQLSYAIGVSQPLSIYLDIFQDNENLKNKIIKVIKNNFDLSPRAIRNKLQLINPIYKKTPAHGHFGGPPENDGSFSWEKIDSVDIFKP